MYLRLKGDVFSVCDQKEMSVTKRIYLLSQHILQHSSLFNLCTLTCNAIPSTYEGKQIHKDDSNERADHSSIWGINLYYIYWHTVSVIDKDVEVSLKKKPSEINYTEHPHINHCRYRHILLGHVLKIYHTGHWEQTKALISVCWQCPQNE